MDYVRIKLSKINTEKLFYRARIESIHQFKYNKIPKIYNKIPKIYNKIQWNKIKRNGIEYQKIK